MVTCRGLWSLQAPGRSSPPPGSKLQARPVTVCHVPLVHGCGQPSVVGLSTRTTETQEIGLNSHT